MTANISGSLPKGDANGLGPIVRQLVEQPHDLHVVLAIVDCKKSTTDNDTGEVVPTARIRRVEVILPEDKATARRLLERSLEKRTGRTVLPLDMEEQLTAAFEDIDVDPRTGEVRGDDPGPQ